MKSIRNGNKCEIGEEGNGGGGEGRGLANARMPRKSFLVFSRWRARGWPRHVVLKTDYHVVCHRAGSEQERGNRKKKRERETEKKNKKEKRSTTHLIYLLTKRYQQHWRLQHRRRLNNSFARRDCPGSAGIRPASGRSKKCKKRRQIHHDLTSDAFIGLVTINLMGS